jgi:predicted enzyme related to lactoylglutathione lyase
VPETKTVKNRVHLDIDVADLAIAVVAAEAVGATRVGDVVYDEIGGFQVMADPEGNEFCFINGPTAITA